ncbi:MAG: hypothetical protein WBG92_01245, partial [Thiohalocapsa sp.]
AGMDRLRPLPPRQWFFGAHHDRWGGYIQTRAETDQTAPTAGIANGEAEPGLGSVFEANHSNPVFADQPPKT